jgi:hypothetical protein
LLRAANWIDLRGKYALSRFLICFLHERQENKKPSSWRELLDEKKEIYL